MSVKRDRMDETQTQAEKYKGPWCFTYEPFKGVKTMKYLV